MEYIAVFLVSQVVDIFHVNFSEIIKIYLLLILGSLTIYEINLTWLAGIE